MQYNNVFSSKIGYHDFVATLTLIYPNNMHITKFQNWPETAFAVKP